MYVPNAYGALPNKVIQKSKYISVSYLIFVRIVPNFEVWVILNDFWVLDLY